jgi:VanZ family protein
MFAMLAVAALYRRPYPVSLARMLGYLFLFALVTEVLQLLVSGRSAQLGDVLIDSAGMITGLMLLRLMRFFSQLAPD